MEVAAVLAAVCAGEGGLVTMPYIVGGIADRFQVSAGVSGLVSSIQFAAMAAVSIILSPRIHEVDRRRLALAAAIITLAGHWAAVAAPSWSTFLGSRIAVGLGEGALLTIGTAAAAATPRPQRTFSLVTFAFVAMGGVIYLSMPGLIVRYGPMSVFYVLLALVVVGLPLLLCMPRRPGGGSAARVNVWRPFPWILLGIACHYMGGNSLWAFSERIGVGMGLDARAIGTTLLVGVLLTMIGPVAANFAQQQWGYTRPILAGVGIHCLSCVALGGAFFYEMYFVAFVLLNVTAFFLVPMYRALTAVIDPSGRVAAASIVVQTVGTAIGPFLASLALLAGGGYPGVGLYAGCLVVISLLLVIRTARRGDGESAR
jgi:predicted MFS family arabinose efflux permease